MYYKHMMAVKFMSGVSDAGVKAINEDKNLMKEVRQVLWK